MTVYKLTIDLSAVEKLFVKPFTFSLKHADGTIVANFTLDNVLVWTRVNGLNLLYIDPKTAMFHLDVNDANISKMTMTIGDMKSEAEFSAILEETLSLKELGWGQDSLPSLETEDTIGRGLNTPVISYPDSPLPNAILMFVDDEESALYSLKCKAAIYGYRNFLDRVYITVFTERFGIKLWDIPKALESFVRTNRNDTDGEYKTVTLNVGFTHIENFQFDGEHLLFNCSLKGAKTSLCIPVGLIVNVGDDRYTPQLAIALPMLISSKIMEDIKKLNLVPTEKPKPKLSLVK